MIHNLPPIDVQTKSLFQKANGSGAKANAVTDAEKSTQSNPQTETDEATRARQMHEALTPPVEKRVRRSPQEQKAFEEAFDRAYQADMFKKTTKLPSAGEIIRETKEVLETGLQIIGKTLESCLASYEKLMSIKVGLYGWTLLYEATRNFQYPTSADREIYYGLLSEESEIVITPPKIKLSNPEHTQAMINIALKELGQTLEKLKAEVSTTIGKNLDRYEVMETTDDLRWQKVLQDTGNEPLPRGAHERLKGFITVTDNALKCYEEDICLEYRDRSGNLCSKSDGYPYPKSPLNISITGREHDIFHKLLGELSILIAIIYPTELGVALDEDFRFRNLPR